MPLINGKKVMNLTIRSPGNRIFASNIEVKRQTGEKIGNYIVGGSHEWD